jgi:prepilin-type N-terminal cleavage/methylation domain-containing protein
MLNKKGLSLVEVMIALVIVLLVFLALMQTALVSIESTTVNILRDEAVSIAEMTMNELRNRPFDDFDLNGTLDPDPLTINQTINRSIKNISNFPFNTETIIDTLNADNKQITITVTWEWKDKTIANGNPYTHRITTIRRRT